MAAGAGTVTVKIDADVDAAVEKAAGVLETVRAIKTEVDDLQAGLDRLIDTVNAVRALRGAPEPE